MVYNKLMPHFFVKEENINNKTVKVEEKDLLNHLVSARRVKVGEKVLFFDNNKIQYETIVKEITKKYLLAEITAQYKSFRELEHDITVAKCVLKQDADYSSLQKATELGVKTIIPVISDNCALKKQVVQEKQTKFQKIADESVKQCERADFPVVTKAVTVDELLLKADEYDKFIVFSERAEYRSGIKEYFKEHPYKNNDKILILIGCEGGFSDREFGLFEEYKIKELSLGKLIMRADTALTAGIFGVIQEISGS